MVSTAELFAEDVATLRETIRANDGENVATGAFVRKVEELISGFYDDIEDLTALRLGDILDLFLIKVLYVNRRSRDAETMAYLRRMLERYLLSSELALTPDGSHMAYLSDMLEETANPSGVFENRFEVYRRFGDNALFISGIFPGSLGRKRARGRMGGAPLVDREYFSWAGKQYYGLAAEQDQANRGQLRTTLRRLAHFFDVYVEALNEMSDRYVMGIDMQIVADKMLDAFNRYRSSREERHLRTARKYAVLLKLDGTTWPELSDFTSTLDAPGYY